VSVGTATLAHIAVVSAERDAMTDREHSPAFKMLPQRARRLFEAIERERRELI